MVAKPYIKKKKIERGHCNEKEFFWYSVCSLSWFFSGSCDRDTVVNKETDGIQIEPDDTNQTDKISKEDTGDKSKMKKLPFA